MSKKAKEVYKLILFASVILLLLIATIIELRQSINKAIKENTLSVLEDTTDLRKKSLEGKISSKIHMLKTVSEYLSNMDEVKYETIMPIIKSPVYSKEFYNIVVGLNNTYYYNDGKIKSNTEFDKMHEEKNGYGFSPMFFSKSLNKNIVYITVPIEKNNEKVGEVLGILDVDVLNEILMNSTLNGYGYSFICNSSGEVISNILNQGNNNLDSYFFDELNFKFSDGNIGLDNIKSDLKNNNKNINSGYSGNEKYFVVYEPIGFSDWYLFSIISSSSISVKSSVIEHLIFNVAIKLILGLLVIFAYIIYINKIHADKVGKVYKTQDMIIKSIPGGVKACLTQKDCEIIYSSEGFYNLTGYTKEDLKDMFENKYLKMVLKEDLMKVKNYFLQNNFDSSNISSEYRIVKKDGDVMWVMDTTRMVKEVDQEPYFISVLIDITSLKHHAELLRISEERYRIISKMSDSVICEYNLDNNEVIYSDNFRKMFGRNPFANNFPKNAVESGLVYKDDVNEFLKCCDDVKNGIKRAEAEIRFVKSDGTVKWCSVILNSIEDNNGNPYKIIANISDIDKLKQEIGKLEIKAKSDLMTGLYNKNTTQTLIEEFIGSEGKYKKHALIIIDIDNFKGINDKFGHLFGDNVLKEISDGLKVIFRSTDIVGRVGGDEFIVFVKNIDDLSLIEKMAFNICNSFKKNYDINGLKYNISGSVGISLYSLDGEDFNTLYHKADLALYNIKKNGKNKYAFYNDKMGV